MPELVIFDQLVIFDRIGQGVALSFFLRWGELKRTLRKRTSSRYYDCLLMSNFFILALSVLLLSFRISAALS